MKIMSSYLVLVAVSCYVYIDLNPNILDANVFLRGTIDVKRFHGKWTFSAYTGPVSEGTFEAIRK